MSQLQHLRDRLRAAGAKPSHERRVLRLWAHALPQDSGSRDPEDFMPRRLRDALPELMAEFSRLGTIVSRHAGADGSERLLVGLADGQTCESVLLARGGVCVSSQIGCAVGCSFCMTGQS